MKTDSFKRLSAILFCYFLASPVFALDACAPDARQNYIPIEKSYRTGVMFRVSKCGVQPSYLFATMHSDDPELNGHFQEATQRLTYVRAAMFELLLTPETRQRAGQLMYMNPAEIGLHIKLPPDYFAKLTREVQKIARLGPQKVDRLKPWAAAVLLEAPVSKADGQILDEKLENYARGLHLELAALENIDEQFSVFSNLPEEKQMALLKDSLDNLEPSKDLEAKIADAYKRKDLATISEAADETFSQLKDTALRDYLQRRLLTERNTLMVQRMEPQLRQGNAFVAIGALHFLHGNGVLKLLEKQGYFVEAVE